MLGSIVAVMVCALCTIVCMFVLVLQVREARRLQIDIEEARAELRHYIRAMLIDRTPPRGVRAIHESLRSETSQQ